TKRQLDGPADVDAVRRLEQRCRELAVDVVVVERRRRPVRERVALANLVVLEAAERVVDAAAPAALDAAFEARDKGVVSRARDARPNERHVRKLRIRTQQLTSRDRRPGEAADAEPRAEERVRHGVVQRVAERLVLNRDLVDSDADILRAT